MNVREILEQLTDVAMSYQSAMITANSCQTAHDRKLANEAESIFETALDEAEKKLRTK